MAMIKCPDCGKDISSSAPVCPNCGYSFMYALPNKSRAKINLILVAAGVLACLIAGDMGMSILLIAGAIIEAIVFAVTFFMALLFGSRAIRIILYFLAFDVGYVVTFLIKAFT